MIALSGNPVTQPWLLWGYGLYALAGVCWLPVVILQLRMANMAAVAVITNSALPDSYWRYARSWEMLSYPAFIAMVGVYWLMVFKPV